MQVIIDTDMGVDDAHALAMALGSPELDICGFTTVSGNTTAELAARNVCHFLDLCGRDIAVRIGEKEPIGGPRPFGGEIVHGEEGLGDYSVPDGVTAVTGGDGIEWMIETVCNSPGQVQVIALGPLTNVAAACRHSDFVENVQRVIFMGGIVSGEPGNVLPLSTANIANDAEAAKKVFHSGVPLVMVGQDVTRDARLTEERKRRVFDLKTPLTEFLREVSAFYEAAYRNNEPQWPGYPLHDLVAVAYAVDSSMFRSEELYVTVETKGEVTLGQTVADRRRRPMGPPNMDVCVGLDYETLFDQYVTRLSKALNSSDGR